MAGGEGTRLRPLTSNQPKPMLPMANIPMMEHVVNLLRTHGFEDIVVTVAFMANAIRTYFDDGSEFGVRMVYATESTWVPYSTSMTPEEAWPPWPSRRSRTPSSSGSS
jgi:mannose-1-phosphate guanylyltransferase/phosphomannomutase